jgi:hypothetical protein
LISFDYSLAFYQNPSTDDAFAADDCVAFGCGVAISQTPWLADLLNEEMMMKMMMESMRSHCPQSGDCDYHMIFECSLFPGQLQPESVALMNG